MSSVFKNKRKGVLDTPKEIFLKNKISDIPKNKKRNVKVLLKDFFLKNYLALKKLSLASLKIKDINDVPISFFFKKNHLMY